MVDSVEIRDAAIKSILAVRPFLQVYTDDLPRDFERPSILVELDSGTREDANIALLQRTETVLTTYFPTLDAHKACDREEMRREVSVLEDVFSGGYLQVGDRALHIIEIKTKLEQDEAYVDVTLQFLDDRPGPGQQYETMQSAELALIAKED